MCMGCFSKPLPHTQQLPANIAGKANATKTDSHILLHLPDHVICEAATKGNGERKGLALWVGQALRSHL